MVTIYFFTILHVSFMDALQSLLPDFGIAVAEIRMLHRHLLVYLPRRSFRLFRGIDTPRQLHRLCVPLALLAVTFPKINTRTPRHPSRKWRALHRRTIPWGTARGMDDPNLQIGLR